MSKGLNIKTMYNQLIYCLESELETQTRVLEELHKFDCNTTSVELTEAKIDVLTSIVDKHNNFICKE